MKLEKKKPLVRSAPKPPRRDETADRLTHHSRDTGIPVEELRCLCIRAGLDLLDQGGLTIRKQVEKLPIYLPAGMVAFLRELGAAAEIEGGFDEFVDDLLKSIAKDSLRSRPELLTGFPELVFDRWIYDPDEKKRCTAAMLAVISGWETTGEGDFVRKEVAA